MNAALLLGSLGAGVAASEVVVRAVHPGQMPGSFGAALHRYDSLLGWEKRPNVAVSRRTSEWDVTITTNESGLRGPRITPDKPSGVRRVLLLGDSFVEAYSVSEAESVSAQLQSTLRQAGWSGAEVLNGGTAGYSTDQELLFFMESGVQWEPDVTVLFFYVNDVVYNVRPMYWRGAKPYYVLTDTGLELRGVPVPRLEWRTRELSDWLRWRSALYRLVRESLARRGASRDDPDPASLPSVPQEFLGLRRTGHHGADEAWALTEALLLELRHQVEAAGSTFVLFHVPSRAAIYHEVWVDTRDAYRMSERDWSPVADVDRLRDICERTATECLFPVEDFRLEAQRLGEGAPLYFRFDGHWSAYGHALAAQIIAEHLTTRR
jgi:hypothetical protein